MGSGDHHGVVQHRAVRQALLVEALQAELRHDQGHQQVENQKEQRQHQVWLLQVLGRAGSWLPPSNLRIMRSLHGFVNACSARLCVALTVGQGMASLVVKLALRAMR